MNQKWNLQDIRPAGSAKTSSRVTPVAKTQQDIYYRAPKETSQETFNDPDLATIDVVDGNSSKKKRVIVTTIIAVVIIAVGFGINVLLGGAEVTIYPKYKDISVQANFVAHTNPQVDELGYELLTLEETGEKQVKASGKEQVSLRAEGKMFVYNTKSTTPQRLVKNTRFESKEGLIYKIKESIEVPGVKKDEKGNLVPGSVVADVYADGTGEQYNLEPGRFTVPGLKGSEQYDSVYGESTVPFSGGFEGEKYIIDEAELSTAKQALHIELRDKLLSQLKEKQPAGFVVYDAAVAITFDVLPSTEYGESFATLKEKGRLRVPMFRESEFAKYLAESTIPDYTGDPVALTDPMTLAFTYAQATTTVSDISLLNSLEFMLKGSTQVVWEFDEKELLSQLTSLKRTSALEVFKNYPAINHAKSEVRPFWASSFPSNPDEIKLITIIGEEGETLEE